MVVAATREEARDQMKPLEEVRGRLESVSDPMALLAGIFAHAPFGLQIYEASGRCLLVNQAFRDLFGAEPPPDYNVLRDEIAEGNRLAIASTFFPIFDAASRVGHVAIVFKDLTTEIGAREQAEQERYLL